MIALIACGVLSWPEAAILIAVFLGWLVVLVALS